MTQLAVRKVMGPAIAVDCELPDVVVAAAVGRLAWQRAGRARFEATGEHELILHGPG